MDVFICFLNKNYFTKLSSDLTILEINIIIKVILPCKPLQYGKDLLSMGKLPNIYLWIDRRRGLIASDLLISFCLYIAFNFNFPNCCHNLLFWNPEAPRFCLLCDQFSVFIQMLSSLSWCGYFTGLSSGKVDKLLSMMDIF